MATAQRKPSDATLRNLIEMEPTDWQRALLELRRLMPVRTSVLLPRPAADGLELTAKLELKHRGSTVDDTVLYHVERVRERPPQELSGRGLTVRPMAPVSQVEGAGVPAVLLAVSR